MSNSFKWHINNLQYVLVKISNAGMLDSTLIYKKCNFIKSQIVSSKVQALQDFTHPITMKDL